MNVTLVGAGPGDPELLTIKALNKLQSADVVLYDRLVSTEIISLVPEHIEKINVGKCVNNHPIPQHEISKLLVEKAKQGKNVVRLKGGDSFVFGRGGEELELLVEENISFEVVPGITSAIAGATYAGIPVTHRNYASSFHVITGHSKENEKLDIDFTALVRTKGTLIFLMSVSSIEEICNGCLLADMDSDMPAAIIENATMSEQRKFLGTIETLSQIALENQVLSPSIIIIGKVCLLSEKLDFFTKKTLLHKKVIVTQARTGTSSLTTKLRDLGCRVVEVPTIKISSLLQENKIFEDILSRIQDYKWLIFTSSVGVNLFFNFLTEKGFDIRNLHHLKIAAVGSETRKELLKRGLIVDYTPGEYHGVALAKGLINQINQNEKLLLLRSKIGSEAMLDVLTNNNIDFNSFPIYDTILENKKITQLSQIEKFNYITFTSSSTVEGFVKIATSSRFDFSKLNAICIGNQTANTARLHGFKVFVSKEATIDSMVAKIKEIVVHERTT